MDRAKKKRIESAGWAVGSTAEFLDLSREEMMYIELRARLSDALKEYRKTKRLSQAALAASVGSSQSRVAKMEAGDPSVTIDLLIRSLIALGVSRKELAEIVSFERQEPIRLRKEKNGVVRVLHPKQSVVTSNPAQSRTAA
jgi:transcriptional regulator with XRE-family HTH domain